MQYFEPIQPSQHGKSYLPFLQLTILGHLLMYLQKNMGDDNGDQGESISVLQDAIESFHIKELQ